MFKRFQQGGMMPPQQGQMMPPDPQQMMQQGQGGAQLPDEVIQILMTLPENIRQYLLSLPEDKMMMELQKIMQEKMAQQQGQGQQGPPMPSQGGEQMASPMMGRYGMKIKAQSGASYSRQALKLPKVQEEISKQLTTKRPELIVQQPIVNSNPNAPKLGQKVMLGNKAATIDMVDGKLVFKYDDGSGIQEVRMAQTETIPTNIINNNAVVNNSQVPQRNFTTTSSSGITNSVAPKTKVITTKPAQVKSSPTTKQQGVTTNPTKKITPAAKPKVTNTPNNSEWSDEEIKRRWMLEENIDNGVMGEIFTVKGQRNPSPDFPIDNSSYIKHVNRVSEIDSQIKKLESNKYSYNNEFKIGQLKAEKRHWEDIIKKAKRDTLRKSTNNTSGVETTNNRGYSDMRYKSGGQLPSALKVSTPLKTIMDRKIEMFKSGGKMKLKTCKHGC